MATSDQLDKIYVVGDTVVRGNPVVLNFTFTGDFSTNGLVNFNRITLQISDQLFDTVANPTELVITSATELTLTPETTRVFQRMGEFKPYVVGFSTTYPEGYVLTSPAYSRLPSGIKVYKS